MHTMSRLAQEVKPLLATRRFGQALRAYDTVDSTNTLAMAWADVGAAEGSTVMAEFQRMGRGRQGRRWNAAPGKNLMLSVILRPRLQPLQLGLITLAASLAVFDVLRHVASPVEASVKWPNDILLAGRKCCGMLLESLLSPAKAPVVVLGIGLNVNQNTFPPELEQRATSILLETGQQTPRGMLAASLLARLEHRYESLHLHSAAITSEYTCHLHDLGKTVSVKGPPPVTGKALGVTETGALRLQADAGEYVVHAGDATLARA